MMRGVKRALPLCLFFAAIPCRAQPNTIGNTTLDYDPVDNLLIATCTVSADYSTEANYGPYEECQIVDTNANSTVASGDSKTSSTLSVTPTLGHTYVAWGEYMEFFIYYTLVWINPPFLYQFDWNDPYYYSLYGNNQQYPGEQYSWWGLGPYNYVTSTSTYLGKVPSNPVTVNDPAYAEVISDSVGQNPGGIEIRLTTYQIYNTNGSIAANIPVGESFSTSNWSCTNASQPTTSTTSCSAPYVTGSNGQLTDEWDDYGTYYTPAGCGVNVIDHWQWCTTPTPKTFMTLTGFIHTADSNINGWVNPPNQIPIGTIFNP